jgi:hypothetical protein
MILPTQPSGYRLAHSREVMARAIQLAIVAHRYDSAGLRNSVRDFVTVARRSGLAPDGVVVALYDVVDAEPILRSTEWERKALTERLVQWAGEDAVLPAAANAFVTGCAPARTRDARGASPS